MWTVLSQIKTQYELIQNELHCNSTKNRKKAFFLTAPLIVIMKEKLFLFTWVCQKASLLSIIQFPAANATIGGMVN